MHGIAIGILAFGFTVSCGGSTSKKSQTGVQRPAIESRVPTLRWVPADAEFVIVGTQAKEALLWMQKGGDLFAEIDSSTTLKLSALADLDVDWNVSASAFGDTHSITAILPATSQTAITAFQTGFRERGATENTYGEFLVLSEESAHGPWSTVEIDGNVVIHMDFGQQLDSEVSGKAPSWLDAILQAGKGDAYGNSRAAKRSLAGLASELPNLWGSADGLMRRFGENEWFACTPLATGIEGVSFVGNASSAGFEMHVDVELSASATKSIQALLSSGQSEGMAALANEAGIEVSLGLASSKAEKALRDAGCGLLANPIASMLQQIPWNPAPLSLHLAGSQFEVDELSGDIALEITMDDSGFVRSLLDKIPGRSWLESSKTLAGEKVKKLSIPTMSSLYYQLRDTRLRFANQKSAMIALITSPKAKPGLLASVSLKPDRIPQLTEILSLILPPDFVGFATQRLSELQEIALRFELQGQVLSLYFSVASK